MALVCGASLCCDGHLCECVCYLLHVHIKNVVDNPVSSPVTIMSSHMIISLVIM